MSEGKILIVDDSEIVLAGLRVVLEPAGFEVVTLGSPDTLPMTVLVERPELVLLDVSMPKLRGDRALQLNRERHQLRDVRVLLHSSRDPEELADLCRRSGADGYIVKGQDDEHLIAELRSWISRIRSGAPQVATDAR